MPCALPLILALSNADSPMLLWLIVGALMALGPVIHSYIRVYDWFKGKPLDASVFVTRAEFTAAKLERDNQIAATVGSLKADFGRMEAALNTIVSDLPAIHRALGRLEGHDEAETSGGRRRRAQ